MILTNTVYNVIIFLTIILFYYKGDCMKKRILLVALMVALLACLFVISTSAADFDKTETVTVTLSGGTT